MKTTLRSLANCLALLVLVSGCTSVNSQINPFLTLTEALGIVSTSDEDDSTTQGTALDEEFREDMTVTFRNNHATADLDVSFVAWVNAGSIRSAEQQDALFTAGYVQLGKEVALGNAYTLPVGTFVYSGAGTAGATAVTLRAATADGDQTLPSTQTITIMTPDAILAFSQPPVSCESVAFVYTRDGEPLESVPAGSPLAPFQGSTQGGGYKTLAQVDVYQCSPFQPGLFFRAGGGVRDANEYVEGEAVAFDFNENPDDGGYFCNVTFGTAAETSP